MSAPSKEPGQYGLSSGVPGDASDMAEKRSDVLRGSQAGLSSETNQWRDDAANAPRPQQATGGGYAGEPDFDTSFTDESPYDEEFRRDYDSRYANADAPYDDYRRAYTHGVSVGQDERHRGRDWSQVEASARERWEARYPESAWERFKAAVRHGWERVTDRR